MQAKLTALSEPIKTSNQKQRTTAKLARIKKKNPDLHGVTVTPPLQRLTRLPSLSHPLPLVFCAHPILNSGCSVSCIAFCLPRVPSLLESLHLALVVFFLLLVVRVVLCPFQSASFRSVLLNFRLQCEKCRGKRNVQRGVVCGSVTSDEKAPHRVDCPPTSIDILTRIPSNGLNSPGVARPPHTHPTPVWTLEVV